MRHVFELSMRRAVLSAALVACVPSFASAQSPAVNVSLTYTFLRDAEADQNFASGATIAATGRVAGWLAATAEVSVSADYSSASSTRSTRTSPGSMALSARASPPGGSG